MLLLVTQRVSRLFLYDHSHKMKYGPKRCRIDITFMASNNFRNENRGMRLCVPLYYYLNETIVNQNEVFVNVKISEFAYIILNGLPDDLKPLNP